MLTSKQAHLLLKLLFSQFRVDWQMIYITLFYRITNSFQPPAPLLIDPTTTLAINTKDDIALIALVEHNENSKKCVEVLRSILTYEQLCELLERMLRLKISEENRKCSSIEAIATLFRGDTIAAYLVDELLKSNKKSFAQILDNECKNFITAIYTDIVKDSQIIPDALPSDYLMSPVCQQTTVNLLPIINKKIYSHLHTDPAINYLLTLIKKYAQHDNNTNPKDLINFLLGNLANRVISSTLSSYVVGFKQKKIDELASMKKSSTNTSSGMNLILHKLQKLNLEWLIANRFLSKVFTYVIATDPSEKPIETQRLPECFHPFMLDKNSKIPYIDFCTKLAFNGTNPFSSNKHSTKFKVVENLENNVAKQELLLYLWVRIYEIYNEFNVYIEQIQRKNPQSKIVDTSQNMMPLRSLYIPSFIRELRDQMSSVINMNNILTDAGQAITALIKKLEKIELFHSEHFERVRPLSLDSNRSNQQYNSQLLSPRVNSQTIISSTISANKDTSEPVTSKPR